MGCVQGRHADPGNGPPATITLGGYGGGRSIGDRRHQTMAPDPGKTLHPFSLFYLDSSVPLFLSLDLGWRRLPNSIATSMGGVATGAVCNDPTEWSSSLLSNESPRGPQQRMGGNVPSDGQSQQQQVLYPARHAWGVCFFNDRSGHFCNVSIVTLAINIAIRAEGLANTFGVVSDQCDTMLNSIERFAREGEEAPDSHHKVRSLLGFASTILLL